jgi:hypothetical protein
MYPLENQAYVINANGEVTLRLSDGTVHSFAGKPPKLYTVINPMDLIGLYMNGKPFMLQCPQDAYGFWYIIVLGARYYGQPPNVISQLTYEEAIDMEMKIWAAEQYYASIRI